LVKSINEFLPSVEILAFFGERGDKQYGVSYPKVVLGQARNGFVSGSASERCQPWIVNVIDVDKRPNDAEQRPGGNVLIDQGRFKRPRK
jgi:hypothetical protein